MFGKALLALPVELEDVVEIIDILWRTLGCSRKGPGPLTVLLIESLVDLAGDGGEDSSASTPDESSRRPDGVTAGSSLIDVSRVSN